MRGGPLHRRGRGGHLRSGDVRRKARMLVGPPVAVLLAGLVAVLLAAPPARAQEAGPGTDRGADRGAVQEPGQALTSAPYDLSLFRDGETRRMRARYGRWTVVCDEIIRLRSRYCSLSAPVADAAGDTVARLDVSTDDAGRPAALLHLPHGTLFDRPLTLGPARPGRASAPRILRGTRCDARDCAAVWALDAADFDALKHDGFTLVYRRTSRLDVPGALLRAADLETVAGLVPSDGFGDAVVASMRAGPLAAAAAVDDLGLRH